MAIKKVLSVLEDNLDLTVKTNKYRTNIKLKCGTAPSIANILKEHYIRQFYHFNFSTI
jgi:hypothetical protein